MNQNQKIEMLKKELESWEKCLYQNEEEYNTFKRGFIFGGIESLKRAIEILEEK